MINIYHRKTNTIMDQYYLITNSSNQKIKLDNDLLTQNADLWTIIELRDKKIDSKLTSHVNQHMESIAQLSIDEFNWDYYCCKYLGISKNKNKQSLWDNWIRVGSKDNRNPIDRRTINNCNDVYLNLCLLTIFLDAIEQNHNRIMILNATNKAVKFGNIDQIIKDYHDIILNKDLSIISYTQINYAYIIHQSIFNLILSEMSYFINQFDDILRIYINTYPNDYQIFNHSNTSAPNNSILLQITKPKLTIDCDQLYNGIKQIKELYFKTEYHQFIRNCHGLTTKQMHLLNYIVCKLPYDFVRLNYNTLNCLTFDNYLNLCMAVTDDKFFQSINIQPISSELPDFRTLYFDHQFYIRLYPCFAQIFKNQSESIMHYINHGKKEKLIANQLLFRLIKMAQEYSLEQYLRKFNSLVKPDRSLLLYDHLCNNYPTNQKPIIYVITRTCNRESLFRECCQSINKQYGINLKHIVSYDNQITQSYVKKYEHIYKSVDLINQKHKIHPNQYIDKIYEHIDPSEPGWVLILDDDDRLMTSYAFSYIEQYLDNPDNLIIWMLYRPDKYIYPVDKNNPVVGEIGSCCYIYHTSKIQKGIWGGNSIGDFTFFKYLFDNTQNHIYIDYPLTGVNYNDCVSGWTAM